MEQRHRVGLDSYDRLFPNQDTMPQGGFGNLIALPLQAGPVRAGNSLFVNTDFVPYPDQWAFLRSLKRLSEAEVRAIEEDAGKRGRILGVRMSVDDEAGEQPWMLPPSRRTKSPVIRGSVPAEIRAVLSNLLYLEKQNLPSGLINRLIRLAAFQNPDFYQAQAMRLLLATGKYLGEGFDDARLDTLFLTMPVSWRGILQQYAGRLHRAHHAKKEVLIYDYMDMQIPMAVRMFERRKKGYAAIGYTVTDTQQTNWDLSNTNG